MASRRPHARTANQLRLFLERGDERVVPSGDGHVAWLGSGAELAEALGIKRQAMTSRLRTLKAAGVARVAGGRRIEFDLSQLEEMATGIRHLRVASSTEQFRATITDSYVEEVTADGGVAYLHRQTGERASVRDLTKAAGFRSPGSTQYHLGLLSAVDDTAQGNQTSGATLAEEPLEEALRELAALLGSSAQSPRVQDVVLETIAAVSRTGQSRLDIGANADANSSRETRQTDALTRLESELEDSKSGSKTETELVPTRNEASRVDARDTDASSRRPHVPPDQRELDEAEALTNDRLAEVFAPLVDAVAQTHPDLAPNWASLASAAARWPEEHLARAIAKLTAQVESAARTGLHELDNPFAVFCAAAKRGDLQYFGVPARNRRPTPADPEPRACVSTAPLRACLLADLGRFDWQLAVETLVDRCLSDDDHVAATAAGRTVVESELGRDGRDYFDQQVERFASAD